MRQKRASEAGLTLLELALSLAIGTVLVTSFFVSYRGLMQAIGLTANELNATSRVADLFETMVQDLDRADNNTLAVPTPFQVTFNVGGVPYAYQLVTPAASQDAYVQKTVNGVATPVGPRHALANMHPFPGTLKDCNNTDYVGFNNVPLFTLVGNVNGNGGKSPQVILHGVIQTSQDAPARYVQTRSAARLYP